MFCAALEMIFRGSTTQRRALVTAVEDKATKTILMPVLLQVLEQYETGTIKHSEVTILNISKTLWYLSRCDELRPTLARADGLLLALSRVATARSLNPECRLLRVRIVAQLANAEGNKVMMYNHSGLVESLLRVAHFDLSDAVRQQVASALMDMSSTSNNQSDMAKNEKLLGTLVKMMLLEKNAATQEAVITTLQNLAYLKENRYRIVSFKNGVALQALKKAMASNADAKARRRAAGALTNLACEETAEYMGNHKGFLETLALVSSKDENLEVQARASLALSKLAYYITIKMECHESLLDALVVSSLSAAPNNVSAVLRVKARDPENREILARHPGILDTLADICVSDGSSSKDRHNALRAIMHLINEPKNHKIMCNRAILDALVVGTSLDELDVSDRNGLDTSNNKLDTTIDSGDKHKLDCSTIIQDCEEAREASMRALERLATEYSNRPIMARHDGLIVVVARAVEREAKAEEAGETSEHGFLAKPLLMSLLLAM
jgi:hypothetical protein